MTSSQATFIPRRLPLLEGEGRRHNLVVGNLHREISSQLQGRQSEAYVSGMGVKVPSTGLCAYPDLVALCDTPQFEDPSCSVLLNPVVIVEVLSDSTEAFDRGEKFAQYRRLETLREYILVAQDRMLIERYRRDGELWILSEVAGTLHLASIDCHVGISEIYEKVEFQAT
jgi:Uma2 family endonuclease